VGLVELFALKIVTLQGSPPCKQSHGIVSVEHSIVKRTDVLSSAFVRQLGKEARGKLPTCHSFMVCI
jgi:hypothetical protein